MNTIDRADKWLLGSGYYRLEDEELNVTAGIQTLERNIPLYRQRQVEVILVISGRAHMMINGVHYNVTNNSLIYLNPYHYYQIDVISPLQYYSSKWSLGLKLVHSVQKSARDQLSDIFYEGEDVVELDEGKREIIEGIFNNMMKEFNDDQFAREVLLIHQAMMLCAYFNRFRAESHKKKQHLAPPSEWRFISEMTPDDQAQNLEKLAEKNQVTLKGMDKFLARETGYGLKQTRILNQIIFASAMLHFNDLSISCVARMLGYKSVANFMRTFKAYQGMSAEEFRESYTHTGKTKQVSGKGIAVKTLIFLMNNHQQTQLCPAVMAAEFNVTESTLNDILVRNFNQTTHELMLLIRMHYAKVLLRATEMHIDILSLKCGFESVSTFNRNFRKLYYMSPVQYRTLWQSVFHNERIENRVMADPGDI
ncbi:MAG: AraC family transcriptional regulator [Bacillota bacterium]|nr:AraC family transcriptional regulator [Bacillota bacterium]MDW7676531.1 AraC family transcriptional regulator [Bacillota bacterium]